MSKWREAWREVNEDYRRGMLRFMDATGLTPHIERLAGWLSRKLERRK